MYVSSTLQEPLVGFNSRRYRSGVTAKLLSLVTTPQNVTPGNSLDLRKTLRSPRQRSGDEIARTPEEGRV
jgi:hypothetical protein